MAARETEFNIRDTQKSDPYNFFSLDKPQSHGYPGGDDNANLGGVLPYFTAHSVESDVGVMWVNSSPSYIDVIMNRDDPSTFLGLVSESGQIEFFVFASTQSPKVVVEDVSIITGYAVLPPIYTLGFHYSEWTDINVDFMEMWDN